MNVKIIRVFLFIFILLFIFQYFNRIYVLKFHQILYLLFINKYINILIYF